MTQVDGRLASLALAVIDLRAHFEAQLRALARAEQALVKCGTSRRGAAFDAAASALRGEIQVLSDSSRSVYAVMEQMNGDALDLVFPGKK
jgi:hypothetical protein